MRLAVERYLAIVHVYSMKPDMQITRKISFISFCAAWFVVIVYSVHAVFFLNKFEESFNNHIYNYFYCSMSGNHSVTVSAWHNRQQPGQVTHALFCDSWFFLCFSFSLHYTAVHSHLHRGQKLQYTNERQERRCPRKKSGCPRVHQPHLQCHPSFS